MGKDKKKKDKPKNLMSNFKPQLPKKERRLVGHLNGKPVYSFNGCAPAVVLDEQRNPKLRSLNGGIIRKIKPVLK